jgi:phosphate-selective porin OprO/OprP
LRCRLLPVRKTAPIDRIEAIERHIRGLQGELKQLKNELGAAKQQLQQSRSEPQRSKDEARQARKAADQARQDAARASSSEAQASQAAAQAKTAAAAAPAEAAEAKVVEVGMPGGRPTISTSDGRLSFALGGQVQFDMGTYFQNPTPTTQSRNSTLASICAEAAVPLSASLTTLR